jgi:octaprenyl-diphosphate synthase
VNPMIREPMTALEARLHTLVESDVEFIKLIGDDLVSAGGKRARPQLVFLASRAIQALTGSIDAREIDFAAVIELLHSASLLHDDLIDDADTRRGAVTAFRRYGNVVSVFAGDFLLSKQLEVLAAFGPETSAFVKLIAETSRDICEGEVLQFQVAALETYSLEHYVKIITGKTAALAAAATKGAAMLSGANEDVIHALETFGLEYGRAFQIRDDLLDLMGDEATIGKPIGGDLREGKATLPLLYLLEDDDLAVREEIRSMLHRRANRDSDIARARDLVNTYGTFERCKLEIMRRAEIAVDALSILPVSPARKELEALAYKEAERVT